MGFLFLVSLIAGLVIFVRVVADIFKRSAWLGALSIVLFPIPFFYVFTHYSGRKLYTGLALWACFAIPYAIQSADLQSAEGEMSAFISALENEAGNCSLSPTVKYSVGSKTLGVICSFANNELEHLGAKEVAKHLQDVVIEPALKAFTVNSDIALVLEFAAPSRLSVCFEIDVDGKLTKQWFSDTSCH